MSRREAAVGAVRKQFTRAHVARRAGDAVAVGVLLGSARSNRSLYTRAVNALFLRKRVRLALEDASVKHDRRKSRRSKAGLTAASVALLVGLDALRRRREPPA